MTINQISLKASSIARGLGAITFLLVIASMVGQFALYLTEHRNLLGFVPLFYLDEERGIPTFFHVSILFMAAVPLLVIYLLKKKLLDPYASRWAVLSFIGPRPIFGLKMSPANRTRPALNLTFIGLLMVSISQLAIAESPDNEKENLAFTLNQLPRPDHVVIVIEENKSYKQIIGNIKAPFINHLANEGALFTNSFAVAHPSQPNYLALFSGSTHGVPDNRCPISLSGDNLASQLQKKGLGFVIYSESMPSVGYDGCSSADSYYERKHNPAVNWQGKNIPPEVNMPFANFPSDYTRLPTVSMVIPNQVNDMHGDQTHSDLISQGDFWLKSNLDAYVQWAKTNNSLLIVTWDENDGLDNNHIPTIFIGPMVKPGRYITRIDHYNVLRTIIDMYGLSSIGESADAKPIVEAWKRDK